MISGLVQILLFQGLGELAAHFFLPLIPGPVVGLAMGLHGVLGALLIPLGVRILGL